MQGTYATQYQKNSNLVKNGQRAWTDIFFQRVYTNSISYTKYTERYLASLIIEEIQIETTTRYHLILVWCLLSKEQGIQISNVE